jgi:hypothetical protein
VNLGGYQVLARLHGQEVVGQRVRREGVSNSSKGSFRQFTCHSVYPCRHCYSAIIMPTSEGRYQADTRHDKAGNGNLKATGGGQ